MSDLLAKIMDSVGKIFDCAGAVTDAADAISNGEIPEIPEMGGDEEEGGEEKPKRKGKK